MFVLITMLILRKKYKCTKHAIRKTKNISILHIFASNRINIVIKNMKKNI